MFIDVDCRRQCSPRRTVSISNVVMNVERISKDLETLVHTNTKSLFEMIDNFDEKRIVFTLYRK